MDMFDTKPTRTSWNSFVAGQVHSQFLQSYEWGEFQEKMGRGTKRYVFTRDSMLYCAAQIFVYPLIGPFSYFYLPFGPVGDISVEDRVEFQKRILATRKETRAVFFHWEQREARKENGESFFCARERIASSLQPPATSLVPLDKTEEDLLRAMHSKTRYNIKLAHKYGVCVRAHKNPSEKARQDFVSLLIETASRDRFFLHPKKYYLALIDFFSEQEAQSSKTPFVRLYIASLGEQALACALVLFFGDTATYVHGASSSQNRNVMATFALHWSIIKDAKKLGYKWYDFWGIATTDSPHDPWAGITRFKKGFGGVTVAYPPAVDCVFSPFLYTLYRHARVFRKYCKKFVLCSQKKR